jgi:hypothetical protein
MFCTEIDSVASAIVAYMAPTEDAGDLGCTTKALYTKPASSGVLLSPCYVPCYTILCTEIALDRSSPSPIVPIPIVAHWAPREDTQRMLET